MYYKLGKSFKCYKSESKYPFCGVVKYSYCSMQLLKQLPIIKTKYDASVRGVTPQQFILSSLKGNEEASRIQRP